MAVGVSRYPIWSAQGRLPGCGIRYGIVISRTFRLSASAAVRTITAHLHATVFCGPANKRPEFRLVAV